MLAIYGLLSVSRAGTILTLGLCVVCGLLTLLSLELAVTHETWREELGRSEWLLGLGTAGSVGISGEAVTCAVVGLCLALSILASFWVSVDWRLGGVYSLLVYWRGRSLGGWFPLGTSCGGFYG